MRYLLLKTLIGRIKFAHAAMDVVLVVTGVLSATFGLKAFILPNNMIDGGVTGISLLTSEVTTIPLSILIFIINVPFILLGFRQNGFIFALKTFCAIIALATSVHWLQFPVVTEEKILVAVFGGFFLGMGIGLSIRGGAVIDGTEILSLSISRRTSLTVGDIILLINVIIFSFASVLLSVETALYSIITYLAASKTVDFIIQGIEEYTGVIIISEKNDEISRAIVNKIGRGMTTYRGRKGFGKRGEKNIERDILFTVVTRLEVSRLKKEISRIDPEAFMVMHSINEIKGGMIKKRRLH